MLRSSYTKCQEVGRLRHLAAQCDGGAHQKNGGGTVYYGRRLGLFVVQIKGKGKETRESDEDAGHQGTGGKQQHVKKTRRDEDSLGPGSICSPSIATRANTSTMSRVVEGEERGSKGNNTKGESGSDLVPGNKEGQSCQTHNR